MSSNGNSKRVYVIGHKGAGEYKVGNAYLVRAANRAQAISHVARGELTCEVANQDTCIQLAAAGVKVQEAIPEQTTV